MVTPLPPLPPLPPRSPALPPLPPTIPKGDTVVWPSAPLPPFWRPTPSAPFPLGGVPAAAVLVVVGFTPAAPVPPAPPEPPLPMNNEAAPPFPPLPPAVTVSPAAPLPPLPPLPKSNPAAPPLPPVAPTAVGVKPLPPLPKNNPPLKPSGCSAVPSAPLPMKMFRIGIPPAKPSKSVGDPKGSTRPAGPTTPAMLAPRLPPAHDPTSGHNGSTTGGGAA